MSYCYTDEQGRIRSVVGSDTTSNYHSHYDKPDKNLNIFNKKKYYDKDKYNTGAKIFVTSCPVCNDSVYFCECSNGGRVFFDSLYPSWNKHPCTDNNNYNNKDDDNYYQIYFPEYKDGNRQSVFFDKINCLKRMEIIPIKFQIFLKNILNYVKLVVKSNKDTIYLRIIIKDTNIVDNIVFDNQNNFRTFISKFLSYNDFSKIISIKDIFFPESKSKIIFYDNLLDEISKKRENTSNQKVDTNKKEQKKYTKKTSKKPKEINLNILLNKGWNVK